MKAGQDLVKAGPKQQCLETSLAEEIKCQAERNAESGKDFHSFTNERDEKLRAGLLQLRRKGNGNGIRESI